MIYFMTGTPGSGKSLNTAKMIYAALRKGKNVIANYPIEVSLIKPKKGKPLGQFICITNHELTTNYECFKKEGKFAYIEAIKNFALLFHKRSKSGGIIEGQTFLIIDECQEIYNNRTWQRPDRLKWVSFYRHHRKYGYDCILISQDDKCIDKQLRAVIEYEFHHRKINNYKKFGKFLGLIHGGNYFVCIQKWYGKKGKDSHIKSKFFPGKKKYYDLYNSSKIFEID